MKVIVTGATGFIGRRLVDQLLDNGFEVVALVRAINNELPAKVIQASGDITKPETLRDTGLGCSRLYHLAAMITFDPAKLDDLLFVNGQGTQNILEAAKRWGIDKTVVVSSACTMGLTYDPSKVMDENSLPDRDTIKANPYLQSKLACENAALIAARASCVIIVNPTSVYGPGDKTLNAGTLVKAVAASKIVPVPSGGTSVVDVEDVAAGIIAAGEKGLSGKRYILTSTNLKFSKVIKEIVELLKIQPVLINIPAVMRRPAALGISLARLFIKSRLVTPQIIGDLFAYKYYSNELGKKELGWVPRFTFRESLERAINYYKEKGLI